MSFFNNSRRKRKKRWRKRLLLLFVIGSGALLYIFWPKIIEQYPTFKLRFGYDESRYDELIRDAAGRHNISPYLVKAVIRQESGFRPYVVGGDGERGLMQIMPAVVIDWERGTGRRCIHPGLLFRPALNIEIGTWYLARALRNWREYRNAEALALAEYNAGRSRARAWAPADKNAEVLPSIGFQSTREYIKNVLNFKREYQKTQ